MTTAAEVVALQADLLDQFHTPHPDDPDTRIGLVTGDGSDYVVPRSAMGNVLDTVAEHGAGSLPLRSGTPSLSPAVAYGISRGRAFRVQENMTAAIVERSEALPHDMVFLDDITPPRLNGFAWLDQTLPYLLADAVGDDAPGVGAITWTTVADNAGPDGVPRELVWVVTLWDDLYRSPWTPKREEYLTRWMPVAVQLIQPGNRLRRTASEYRPTLRIIAALWQMLGETVPGPNRVEHADEAVDRRTMRAARRAGMGDVRDVTTVVLRRQSRPVVAPGTGAPHTSRVLIEAYEAWRWIGSEARGDRRKVRRKIAEHWSASTDLPIRERKIVSELRR